MRFSLSIRAACACVATTLVLWLGPEPSFARTAASARPAIGPGHFHPIAPRGFNRFGSNRFGASDFGFERMSSGRFGFNRRGFDRFGWNQWTMWNGDAWGWNPWGLAGWGGWGVPVSAAAEPAPPAIIDGAGPQLAITVNAGPETGAAGEGSAGGCVIHKLIYDRTGKYVGERQTPEC